MKNIKIILLIIIVLLLASIGYFVLQNNFFQSANNNSSNQPAASLEPQVKDEARVSVEVAPINFSLGKPFQFKVSFTTHEGNLDFDMTKISYLIDDKNNKYIPNSWDGGSGGHHLSGTLSFPALAQGSKTMKLIIENVYNVEKREFFWEIK